MDPSVTGTLKTKTTQANNDCAEIANSTGTIINNLSGIQFSGSGSLTSRITAVRGRLIKQTDVMKQIAQFVGVSESELVDADAAASVNSVSVWSKVQSALSSAAENVMSFLSTLSLTRQAGLVGAFLAAPSIAVTITLLGVVKAWIEKHFGISGTNSNENNTRNGSADPTANASIADKSEDLETVKQSKIVTSAEEHLGEAYISGGDGNGGYDCIGFVRNAYKSIGIDLPRSRTGNGTSTWAEQGLVNDVTGASDAPKPGDILCWYKSSIKSGQPDHVAIYTGYIKTDVISGVYNGYRTNADGYLVDEYGSLIDCINALNEQSGVCYMASSNYRNGVNTSYTDVWRAP